MRLSKLSAALIAAALLAGCGGGGGSSGSGTNTLTAKVQFNSLVSFGDSLSDVGTYAVGTVKSLGGGQYTINAPESKNWIELIAAQLALKAPCAAQTGLEGDPLFGFSIPVANHTGCTAYAQGGARVTNPVGPGNRLLGGANAILGQLTVPVVTQMQNHLNASGGRFQGNEIVFVLAGANDVFLQLAAVGAGIDPAAAVTAMGTAGAELATYVNNLILAKGARYVTVINVPDVSKTPFALAQSPATQTLINTMVTTFNTQLQQGLANSNVLLVDAYSALRDQTANPARYGIANATTPACDLLPEKNLLGTALVCTKSNVIAGNVDNYLFADTVHPAPYGYQLLAKLVADEMKKKGWL